MSDVLTGPEAGAAAPARVRVHTAFLNVGHFLDHLFMLIYASVAALVLVREWGMSYAALLPYATPGFIAFGVFSLPAGWLADRWSRQGMMAVFFIGAGLGSMLTAAATTPLQIALGLFITGIFAAIYHPVGLALVVDGARRSGTGMAIAVNGVFGNLGVGSAALLTGYLIDTAGWRWAFIVPGAISIVIGLAYIALFHGGMRKAGGDAAIDPRAGGADATSAPPVSIARGLALMLNNGILLRCVLIIVATAALGSLVFQSTTFALPKIFEERLDGLATSATLIGWLAFVVFTIASLAQLVVGRALDRFGPRPVLLAIGLIQVTFFALMPGLRDHAAVLVAVAFMLGAFGQIPINDFMIGRLAKRELRASMFGARFVVSFSTLAVALPFIAWVHANHGFDTLFYILAVTGGMIVLAALALPRTLPEPA
ncbi:MAG: MFS transporter [Pseudomonadota bacterium]